MPAPTLDRVQRRIEQLEEMDVQQSHATIAALPAQVAYEGRFAVQTLVQHQQQQAARGSNGASPLDLTEIIEPVARLNGWVEALIYVIDAMKERETTKTLFGASPDFGS